MMSQSSSVPESDSNDNQILYHCLRPGQYFTEQKLEDAEKMGIEGLGMRFKFVTGIPSSDAENVAAINSMKRIHIFEEEHTPEEARMFWNKMPSICEKWGSLVEELTLELFNNDEDDPVHKSNLGKKIDFLASLHKNFPNLKALYLKGRGQEFQDSRIQALHCASFDLYRMKKLEILKVDPRISSTNFAKNVKLIMMGSENLREVTLTCFQLAYAVQPYQLPSVETLHLIEYGYEDCDDQVFPSHITDTFVGLKNLYLKDMIYDESPEVPDFVQKVATVRHLEVFGVDNSAKLYSNKAGIKIIDVDAVYIDMYSLTWPSIQLLEYVDCSKKVILANWDAKMKTTDRVYREVKKHFPKQWPSLTIINMEGKQEHMNTMPSPEQLKPNLTTTTSVIPN